jgi:hypothetical protein
MYIEHHSLCHLVGIGTHPTPLPQASVPSPSVQRVGGHTLLRLRGWGSPNSDDWRKGLALCLLCVRPLPLPPCSFAASVNIRVSFSTLSVCLHSGTLFHWSQQTDQETRGRVWREGLVADGLVGVGGGYGTVIAMLFEKMLGVHWNISAHRDSKTLLKNEFFNILSRCLQIWL